MIIKQTKRLDVKPSEITTEAAFLNRRKLIKTAAIAGGFSILPNIITKSFASLNERSLKFRKTSLGRQMTNINVYDSKRKLRKSLEGEFPIHGSIHKKEAIQFLE